ncbi:MAG: hypothetical protein ACJARD_001437 [Alphaproteobacteria bacterium]|jgi:hypothetical protein
MTITSGSNSKRKATEQPDNKQIPPAIRPPLSHTFCRNLEKGLGTYQEKIRLDDDFRECRALVNNIMNVTPAAIEPHIERLIIDEVKNGNGNKTAACMKLEKIINKYIKTLYPKNGECIVTSLETMVKTAATDTFYEMLQELVEDKKISESEITSYEARLSAYNTQKA